MSVAFQCLRCRAALAQSTRNPLRIKSHQRIAKRHKTIGTAGLDTDEAESQSSAEDPNTPQITAAEDKPPFRRRNHDRLSPLTERGVAQMFQKPTWSVRSLLPSATSSIESPAITSTQLHHLLRLSALPLPSSPEQESEMLGTLQSQLHFVREIQAVDTTGVEPLQALRDETEEGIKEITVGLEELKEALSKEDVVGRMRRPRRRRGEVVDTEGAEEWDVLGPAKRKVGKYFVVDSSTGTDTQGTVDDTTSSKTDAA